MHNFVTFLLATLVCGVYSFGNAAILPPVFLNYQVANKEIHLKHGKLHPHDDQTGREDEEHLVYKYRWLGDDIVKTEGEFEGEIDEEYTDKEKKVKLPGGCELTEDQFLELESFEKETYYVKKWVAVNQAKTVTDTDTDSAALVIKEETHSNWQCDANE